jgi:CBS domain containing-hemolysin-like protein
MTPPMIVNENMKLDDMIRQMQKEKKHMAVVIDEHGGTSGIITLEDAIEEVWGEIYDEHDSDVEQSEFVKIDDHNFIADAEITLEDLFEKLGIEHLPSKNYANLGAFLFELAEKSVPKQNQILEFVTIDDRIDENAEYYEVIVKMIFKLIKVENNRIRQVRITIQEVSDKI